MAAQRLWLFGKTIPLLVSSRCAGYLGVAGLAVVDLAVAGLSAAGLAGPGDAVDLIDFADAVGLVFVDLVGLADVAGLGAAGLTGFVAAVGLVGFAGAFALSVFALAELAGVLHQHVSRHRDAGLACYYCLGLGRVHRVCRRCPNPGCQGAHRWG